MSLNDLSKVVKKKEVSPVEIVRETLKKIHGKQEDTNAFITIADEEAMADAERLERELLEGRRRSDLHGIPVAVKDNIYTKGIRTTMASEVYANYTPDKDAFVIKKLKAAGAVVIGKTNLHEFAYGPIGDRSYFGPTFNPYDKNKITGGSSGGSAAAVGAGVVDFALGTDTGGSIRIPSSLCGIVGMKPTFGLVSKRGVHDLAYSLDHVGPMTATVKDNALLLNLIAGYDAGDPYSINGLAPDYRSLIGHDLDNKVIGIPSNLRTIVDSEVWNVLEECIKMWKRAGATVEEVEIPVMNEIIAAQSITIQAEASAVHEQTYEMHKDKLEEEVYERIGISRKVPGYQYVKYQERRSQLTTAFNQVFGHIDVLMTATLPILPTEIGKREVLVNGEQKHVREELLRLTSPTNYTGHPSISVPGGKDRAGLPIGVQLIGPHRQEALLYQFASFLEGHRSFSRNDCLKRERGIQ
ncbi:Asp-tRNA(Asn)/Glu-tRNA(Gln) amidotransferase subunit GatA [Bacillus sp. SB49]|uniref:amidase n=1 Tax=Bacillus sp. SB49 TaxID=1071080 RepID=UPI0003FAD4D7|nr:amidase [Bacillus sp. SB49]QHT46059.1 Asp-tRNA(Asn)/Glu-tRNA(Gln) amidotransferase subunit GatA [Bacillus sp. SB49]